MRLEKLQVQGFGHLQDKEIELKGPVTVLYGPNEAGKSTLLGFVRAMLFGIPSRTYGAMRYEPVRGGAHGGLLTLRDNAGSLWTIERYARTREGSSPAAGRGDRLRITRTGPDGELRELPQEELERELLGGMSKEMFRQLFAISLSELQEVSALQSEEMSRFLFHAGIGGGAAVLRGEKKLAQEMDKLYRPRGRNQEMAGITQSIEHLERQAAAAKALLPRYREVLKELEEVGADLEAGEAELERRSAEALRLDKAAATRADWVKREALRAELAELPERAAFPEQGLSRWERLQEEKARLELEAAEFMRKLAVLHSELGAVRPDRELLEREAGIRSLAGRLARYESGVREAAELRSEAEQIEGRLAHALRSIHPDWTADELRAFGGTVGERETVRRFIARFQEYDKAADLLHHERVQLEREASALEAAHGGAMEQLQAGAEAGRRQFSDLVPGDRNEVRRLWSEIQGLLDRWRAVSASVQEQRRAAEAEAAAKAHIRRFQQRMLNGTGVLTMLLPVLLWMVTHSVWSALLGGVVLFVIDAYLFLAVRESGGRKPRQRRRGGRLLSEPAASPEELRLREILPRLIAHPLTAAGSRSVTASLAESERWDEEERLLRRLMEQWQLWDQRQAALEAAAAEARLKTAGKLDELSALQRELARKETEFAGLAREWEDWLRERRLSGDLSPEAAMDVFRLAEQGREWLARLESLSAKHAAAKLEADAFERDGRALLGELRGTESAAPGAMAATVRQAKAELDIQLELEARRQRLADRLDPLEEELGRRKARLEAIAAAERHLLDESGAEDGEMYLRFGAEAAKRERLYAELRQAELVMFGTMDEAQRRQLEELQRDHEEETLIRRTEKAGERLQEAKQHRQRLLERRGRLLQEKETLEQRGLEDDVNQQLAEQQAALGEAFDRYAVMAVSQELIARVRKIYEEERQPQVLQQASRYFEKMTGGVYGRILVKMGSQELLAEHRDVGPVASSYLSRGTAEQLYLAMRFALSEAVSGRESLPLLLDDLFVNFDAGRLAGVLSVLKEVSESRQLILMTCHAHVAEGVRTHLGNVQLVELA
ncbi:MULTISPECIES: AAA family ATPase [Paenibacillus]|uniref:AAA family ATPase n=1 Tax=Paenibacillus TaxID=44249 RepID=UPI002FE2D42F